jgi:hypothetical protein
MRIAEHIDSRSVRLRASPEGRRVIEAIERLAARMRAADKSEEIVEMLLRDIKGVSETDRAIQDTLWVKYRIKMSDSETLELSNYLVKNDPMYPTWSESELIKDYSRINEAGNPLQVFILKKPDPYYQQYLAFKRKGR